MNVEEVEYQLQHFSFCSEDMISENRLLIQTLIQQSLLEFTDWYVQKYNVADEPAMTLRSKCYPKASQMFAECQKSIGELSELFRTTLAIPENVLLPSDILHKRHYTAEQVAQLKAKVAEQDKQLRQGAVFLAMLHNEIAVHERLAPCVASEEQLLDLVDLYRQEDIVPAEDAALVDDLAEVMLNVIKS